MIKRNTIVAVAICSIFLTACSGGNQGQIVIVDDNADNSAVVEESTATDTATEDSSEAVQEEDLYYSYNPHICPKKLYDAYGPDEWEAFFNLCDALRAGEDTFECSSREVYEWCFSGGPLDEYFPVARFNVQGDFLNGYSDGVGHFTYEIPKEEFMQKQAEFEQLVVDILKENVRKDYTDFEKCIVLYEYMTKNYTYDWEECENNESDKINDLPGGTYGTYRTFRDKTGICDDLSSVYNFLLLQCGVEAVKYEGANGDSSHAWTYVTIDDVGYFIDPTWGIPDEGEPYLDYFMMTEADRAGDFGDNMYPIMYYYDHKNTNIDFSAKDDRYAVLHGGIFVSLDREQKIMHYTYDGEPKEFHYE